MRLAKAVGLATEDIKLDHEYPHLIPQQHPWQPLKAATGDRHVQLVGASLWAARRMIDTQPNPYAFPRYTTAHKDNASHATVSPLNKWLKGHAPEGCVVHSLRHSMREGTQERSFIVGFALLDPKPQLTKSLKAGA